MGGGDLAADAMAYVGEIAPLLLVIGGVSFADIAIGFLIKMFRKMGGKIKW